MRVACESVKRGYPSAELAVVLRAVYAILRERGEDRAVARERLALDVTAGVPQLRAQHGSSALEVHRVDVNDDDDTRRFFFDHETLYKLRVRGNLGPPKHPQ